MCKPAMLSISVTDFCLIENPCQNNGTCHSLAGGATCYCTAFWTGANCTIPGKNSGRLFVYKSYCLVGCPAPNITLSYLAITLMNNNGTTSTVQVNESSTTFYPLLSNASLLCNADALFADSTTSKLLQCQMNSTWDGSWEDCIPRSSQTLFDL